MTDLTFHELRGAVVTRFAIAGCMVPEIATITGHSLKDVGAVLDSSYLNRDYGLAASAIEKLETRTKMQNGEQTPPFVLPPKDEVPSDFRELTMVGDVGFEPTTR